MSKVHSYHITTKWTGNLGKGTNGYTSYDRNHVISIAHKNDILGSSDPSFRGDKTRHNPEELLVTSLSACHMLWYLHLCSEAGVVVVAYSDNATGLMEETANEGGRFKEVTLYPHVVVRDRSMVEKANELHHQANKLCFIANSCNFQVHHKPHCTVENEEDIPS